jgi:hypothetical protein
LALGATQKDALHVLESLNFLRFIAL